MRSSSAAARAAGVLGALAILAVPAGILVSRTIKSLTLLESLWVSVPVAVVLGLAAVALTRRARFLASRSIYDEPRSALRVAAMLAWAGVYVGVTAAIALGVYGALRWAQ